MLRFYFICVSIAGISTGLLLLASRLSLIFNGYKLLGVVERKQKRVWSGTDGDSYAYHLVIGYVDKNGLKKSFTEQNSIPTFFYNVGDNITLIQNPKNPEKIMVRSSVILFSAPLTVLLLSAVAGYVGFR